jgi:hypothetical protein
MPKACGLHYKIIMMIVSDNSQMTKTCGLYYKIIMMIVSDNRKWTLYHKIIMMILSALLLALAIVINNDRKWCSKLWRHLQTSFWRL